MAPALHSAGHAPRELLTMLNPNELLGLYGAELERRLLDAAQRLGPAAMRELTARLSADALENGVTYERDDAVVPIRIMLRPLAMLPEQNAYVHHVCGTVLAALQRLPELYLSEPDVASVLPLEADEQAWVRQAWSPGHRELHPVYGRLDAVLDLASARWRDTLWFLEPNLSGVGGIHYAPVCEQLVARDVMPGLREIDPRIQVSVPRDQRELFLLTILDHARALGIDAPTVAFVEPKYDFGGPCEQPLLLAWLTEQHGLRAVHVDPRELVVRGGKVFAGDLPIDIAYRDYETRDLLELERELGVELTGMRQMFRQNRVISALAGDFDHKSAFELLTDETLAARYFSAEEQRVFRRHILWTRILRDVTTTLPSGDRGSLVSYARAHRSELVLKPNRGYGGRGIVIGEAVDDATWSAHIDEALSVAPGERPVLQRAVALPVHHFPVLDERGRVAIEPFYTVMGFASTPHGVSNLCRVSQQRVVNVAQRGGIAAVLDAHPQRAAHLPRAAPQAATMRKRLTEHLRDLRGLDAAIALLGWDEETYLPEGARAGRGEQLGTLEAMRQRLLSSHELADLLDECGHGADVAPELECQIAFVWRQRRLALAIPESLTKAFAAQRSETLGAWETARESGDARPYLEALGNMVRLVRERAQATPVGSDLYDALLDEHEPGLRTSVLLPVLERLRAALAPRVRALADPTAAPSRLACDEARQWSACRRLLADMGFDPARGRLDRSSHPFTLVAGADDVRLTLRVDPSSPFPALLAALHEGGHAIYDQGLGRHHGESFAGEAPSMGLHEAHARLWENVVGRDPAFYRGQADRFRSELGIDLSWGAWTAAAQRPSGALVRVSADEQSYDLHIALRVELERSLLFGELNARDLPVAWDELTLRSFGRRPRGLEESCLQDVHWALGSFAYFPSYTVGNIYAANIAAHYERTGGALSEQLARGDLRALSRHLDTTFSAAGWREDARDFVEKKTGSGLDPESLIARLEKRYGADRGWETTSRERSRRP